MNPRALVFSGQGAHRKGMCMNLLKEHIPSVTALWDLCKDSCFRNFGFRVQEAIQENPPRLALHDDALDWPEEATVRRLNRNESFPCHRTVTHPKGVMSLSYVTQPCMVAAQLVAFAYLEAKIPNYLSTFDCIAGHSLGEFSALTALKVFSPQDAMSLTFQRGLAMERSLGFIPAVDAPMSSARRRDSYLMYACDPTKAKLHGDAAISEDFFFCIIELISVSLSSTTSFVEAVNYNILHRQYVVAGDATGLAVLGKCLDPSVRTRFLPNREEQLTAANLSTVVRGCVADVLKDQADGVLIPKDTPHSDFVTSSARRYGVRHTFRRFLRGPDDGYTPALSDLTHLTLQEDGRSGLKRKSWFMPLSVEIPFHSSHLRRAQDDFISVVYSALPEERVLRSLLSVSGKEKLHWIVNLTGKTFRPMDKDFQEDVRSAICSLNVGEVTHVGRYKSDKVLRLFERGVQQECVRDIVTALLAAQLAHPVMWIDTMNEMVMLHGVREVHEVSPVKNLTDMFSRSLFSGEGAVDGLVTKSFPADQHFFDAS